ncbi:hypothetical protein P7C70_g1322, partial [Phenoliferia sp. Uapishka_3]
MPYPLHLFTFIAVFLTLLGSSIAAPAQLAFTDSGSRGGSIDALFKCPSFTVRCVRDGKWPSGIVGNIGPKEFVSVGIRCNQAHEKRNTVECNATFPAECEGTCQAFGPVPF